MCMSRPVRAHLCLERAWPHHAAASAPAFASAMADLAAVPPLPCRRTVGTDAAATNRRG